MAPPQPQQLIAPCYFLQIPPEMRLRIYEYAFPYHQYCFVVDRCLYRDHCCDSPHSFTLLATCRRIHTEATTIYLDRSTFRFNCCAMPRYATRADILGRLHRVPMIKRMRRVVINTNVGRDYNSSTLDALDVLDLLRTSEWLSEAKSVTLRLDHQAPFTRGTHDMLTAFATIRTACPITLVLQRNHGKDGRVAVHKATGGCEELVRMITDIENRPGHHGFMAPDDNDDWADDVSGISTDDSWTYPFMAQIPNDCLNNSDCRRERCGQVAYRDEYGIMLGEEFDYREVDYDGNITANGYDPESYEGWSSRECTPKRDVADNTSD